MTQNSVNTASRWIQKVVATTTSIIDGNVTIPLDNTKPQNTEGVEIMTLSITPKFSNSTLLIDFVSQTTANGATPSGIVALFQDTGVDSLSSTYMRAAPGKCCELRYIMTSGTTSSTTFKVRIGRTSSTGYYTNSDSTGNALMGGVMITNFSITEML